MAGDDLSVGIGRTGGLSDVEAQGLPAGTVLADRYEVRALLGAGGMGAVYRVYDRVRKTDVAAKVMLPSLLARPKAVERFVHEAETSLKLAHERIVRVYDVNEDGARGVRFFTMELLEGRTLRAWLDERRKAGGEPTAEEALEITRQVLDALAYAHRTTVHRDLKPENIFLLAGLKVKVLDFGIAKLQTGSAGLTGDATVLGTAYYMAPEQRAASASVDGRADLYSVTVILYEMLTGKLPVGRWKSPSEERKALPKGIDELVLRGLALEPEGRPASAAAILDELRAIRAPLEGGAARPRATRSSRRTAAIAAGLLVAAGVSIAVLWPRPEPGPPDPAEGKSAERKSAERKSEGETPGAAPAAKDDVEQALREMRSATAEVLRLATALRARLARELAAEVEPPAAKPDAGKPAEARSAADPTILAELAELRAALARLETRPEVAARAREVSKGAKEVAERFAAGERSRAIDGQAKLLEELDGVLATAAPAQGARFRIEGVFDAPAAILERVSAADAARGRTGDALGPEARDRVARLGREVEALVRGLFELEQALGERDGPRAALLARLGEARERAGRAQKLLEAKKPDTGERAQELLRAVAEIVAEARTALEREGVSASRGTSMVVLEVAAWVPARDSTYGWWGVVAASEAPERRVGWSRTGDRLLVSPGRYDIYWAQDYDHREEPLRIASNVEVKASEVAFVSARSGIRIDVPSWVPPRDRTYGWWGVRVAGSARGGDPLHWTRTDDALLLPPGRYDVYWVQTYDHQGRPLLLARDVEVPRYALEVVRAHSGIRLETGTWVPPRDATYGFWGVLPAGSARGGDSLHWTRSEDALLLPPGRYDVYWVQTYDHRSRPLLLARDVEVPLDGPATVRADSGLRLHPAPWVPAPDSTYGWWGVVRAGSPPDEPLHWARPERALVLPPALYDVYWVQGYDHRSRPLPLARNVEVRAGEVAAVHARSGIRLSLPADAPPLDATYGWWGAAPAGRGADARIHWSNGSWAPPLVLPPGTYDIFWKQDYDHPAARVKGDVVVKEGELIEAAVTPPR